MAGVDIGNIKVVATVQSLVANCRLLLLGDLESDLIPPVRALIFPLIIVHPRDLTTITHVHQRREHLMVAVATDSTCLVGVYLELVPYLVPCAAVLQNAYYFRYVDWFFTHCYRNNCAITG